MLGREKSRRNGGDHEAILAFLGIFILIMAPALGANTIILSHQPILFPLSPIGTANAQSTSHIGSSTLLLPYQNPAYGLSIQYPFDWNKEDGGQTKVGNLSAFTVAFYSPPPIRSAFLKVIELNSTQPVNATIPQLLTEAIKRDMNITRGFEVIQASTNGSLAGKSAYILVSTAEIIKNIRYQTMEVGTLSGNSKYTVIYEALASNYFTYLPTVQKMIDSFKLLK
jgi:PsbP